MIIQCGSCTRKFLVKDKDIPKKGRSVQCGYCSVTWHQMPAITSSKTPKLTTKNKPSQIIKENLSVEEIKASDGKTYKFLGSQWAQLLPSGKTGLFAKKSIGRELDTIKNKISSAAILTGRKKEGPVQKRQKKKKEIEINPSGKTLDTPHEKLNSEKTSSKQGLGFFGYIFLIIVIGFSIVGMLKTFEND